MSKINVRNWTAEKIEALVKENPDGFTVDITTGEKITHGYAVAMTHGLSPEDAAVVANLMEHGNWMPSSVYYWTIGGWYDVTNKGHEYVIDIGFVVRWKEAAITFGKVYNQDAIFDLNTNECVTLKGA